MGIERESVDVGAGRTLILETGKLAKLAAGSVLVRQGDTVVLVTACSSDPRPGIDFFPLTVDYREKFSAAGKFPGGFFKREGRPSEKEILTARMTDRPLRPLFPKGFQDEVQVMSCLLSADGQNESDVLSMLGASVALMLSDIPFGGPLAALRVGRVDGQFVANPTHAEMDKSDLDLVYAGAPGKVIMIEGSAAELSEQVLSDAMAFADTIVRKLCEAQVALAARAGKPKRAVVSHAVPAAVQGAVDGFCRGRLDAACRIVAKQERQAALDAVYEEMVAALTPTLPADKTGEPPTLHGAFEQTVQQAIRRMVVEQGRRLDGRSLLDLRPISCEVGLLPRTHGSALFSRGETQALVTVTLGPESDAQDFDQITRVGEGKKRFMLHYNFPNFSTGETGRIGAPGRREIGHGALAERSVARMLPKEYPYTVRCVSDIFESNGSSSMASVCGATLSLMDAGVPITRPVAGISVGLVTAEDGRQVFLTDILGSEDHYGDMDFKVAGTRQGITGFQLDLKIAGLDLAAMDKAMRQNREARMKILDLMAACIAEPRPQLSPYAPQITTVKINPEKIGALIGPGGKVIRGITERTGTEIDIQDDGSVNIFALNAEAMEAARREIDGVTAEAQIGRIYKGEVKTIRDFGAFVEILPGQDGLLHISEMANYRVEKVEDICKVGDWVSVKVIDIDDRGRIRLSRRAALEDDAAETK